MKNLIFSIITLLIFLQTATQAQNLPDPVLDWDGNPLTFGQRYYVLPAEVMPGAGGGVVPYPVSNVNCTYGVSQSLYEVGVPLRFTVIPGPANYVIPNIRENSNLGISFDTSVGCGPSDMWTKGHYDNATEQYFVMIGNDLPPWLIGGGFQIRKVGGAIDSYKFAYCPSTRFPIISSNCDDVKVFFHDGVRRLVVSNSTTDDTYSFHIKFRKYLKPELAMY